MFLLQEAATSKRGKAPVEECEDTTPACKKPRLADRIDEALEITPPPVIGRQSVSWAMFNLNHDHSH